MRIISHLVNIIKPPQDLHSPDIITTEKSIVVNGSTQYEDIQDHGHIKLLSLCNSCTKHVQTDNILRTSKRVQGNPELSLRREMVPSVCSCHICD